MYEFSLFLSQIRLPFEPQTCIYNFLLGKSIKIFRSLHLQYGTPDCFSSPLTSQWQMSFPFFNTFPVFSDIPVLVLQLPLATANCRAQSGLQPVLSDCYHLEPLHLNLNSLSVGSFPTPVLNLSLWVHTHTSKNIWTYSLCGHFHTLRIMLLKKKSSSDQCDWRCDSAKQHQPRRRSEDWWGRYLVSQELQTPANHVFCDCWVSLTCIVQACVSQKPKRTCSVVASECWRVFQGAIQGIF